MAPCVWLHLLVHCFAGAFGEDASEITFALGIFHPFTQIAFPISAAVAFDLDFRKNHDEEIRSRFGPPILNVSGLDSRLRIRPYLGTSHGSPAIGVRTALDWFLASSNSSPVVGVVGGLYSSVSVPVSSNAAVFEVPLIAHGATNPSLSDKAEHPYFSRTAIPDTLTASAQWAWMNFFEVPSVAYMYATESYGEGLFAAFFNLALLAGQTYRVNGIGVGYDPSGLLLQPHVEALARLRTLGNRFVVLILNNFQFNSFAYQLELEGSFSAYQWLLGEGLRIVAGHPHAPSRYLDGGQSFEPAARGIKFPAYKNLLTNLTVDDIYGSEARDRYKLDDMQISLFSNDTAPLLTAEDLTNVELIDSGSTYMVDALYAFVFAINALLTNGTDPSEIKGRKLLEQVRQVSFEGVSGDVAFNAAGDRLGSFHFANMREQTRVDIGIFDSGTGELSLQMDPVWVDGNESRYPPLWLYDCLEGFENSRQTAVCEPCRKGIGCGYQADVGFPLGVLGPITSVSQTYLAAAVLFDLDFRKNTEPELRARFGPPIFNVTNLDPRLRFKVQIGTSNSQPEVGVNSALDWLQGNGDFYRVAGIAGGFHSAVSTPISSLASVFQVPMVSWASSSPALSDKSTHPYFSRTAPSDAIQGSAMWAWVTHFVVPSAAFVYTMEPYGAGLYGFVNDLAIAQSKGSRIHGVAVVHQPSSYDLQVARDACEGIHATGSRFIILGMSGIEGNAFMHVMEQEDMLYGGFQVFGSESVTFFSHAAMKPSKGMPIGFQQFQPVTQGLLYPAFQEMFRQLTPNDVYGHEAIARYMLEEMQVSLDDAGAPALTAADIGNVDAGIDIWASFLLDAAYTFVIAINNLLLQGIEPANIYGAVLLDEIRRTEFEGVSGLVKFDTSGDRASKFTLWNVQPAAVGSLAASGGLDSNSSLGNSSLVQVEVAFYDASLDRLVLLHNASMYWAGGMRSNGVPQELLSCNPGFEWDLELEACSPCPAGWFSAGGRAACEACPPGTTMSQGTSCRGCKAGTFSAYGDANCTTCAEGTFAAAEGQSACDTCPVGRFGPQEGLEMCSPCSGARVSTMVVIEVNGELEYTYTTGSASNSSCGCDRGARPDVLGDCVVCGEGLICKGLDGVSVAEGFYSAPDLSIFRCHGDDRRCIGGVPGKTCARGRRGIACADCQEGMRPGDDGMCVDCEGGDLLNTLIIGLMVGSALVAAYFAMDRQNRAVQSHGFILCAIAGGQFITITQTLSVVNMITLAIEPPLRNVLEGLSAITFNIGLLRMSCLGASDPVVKYTAKIAMIFMALTAVVLLHCVFVVLLHGCAFRARRPALYGTLGTVCVVFYISVTSTVLEPLQCLDHPNGKWTMRAHPGVLCWETEDHTKMAAMGLAAFLTVPVAVGAAITAIVWQYPSRMNAGDIDFLKSFSFLFFRYRPPKYWFVLVQFLRSLLVALVLLIPEVTLQVVILQLIILVCILLTLRVLPWRGDNSNLLDCMCGSMMLIMLCIVAQFIEDEDRKNSLMAFLGAVVVVTIVAMVMVAGGFGLYCRFGPRPKPYDFFLCHHKAGAGAFARLLKFLLLDTRQLKADVFVDSDNLENLDSLFGFVCSDTANLAILASSAVFTRPWCVGEMCTARLASVPTVVVAMYDIQLPDDEFVQQLPQRVSNIEVLTESGMELEMLRETMRWVAGLAQYPLPHEMSLPVLDRFARCLISGDQQQMEAPAIQHYISSKQVGTAIILYDTESCEAVSSSLVLLKMLMKSMATASQHIPCLLDKGQDIPLDMSRCVVMCSAACLDRYSFLQAMLQIHPRSAQLALYPVLAEASFRVPSNDQLQSWAKQPPAALLSNEAGAQLAEVVRQLFKGIATTYQPHHASEAVLKVGATQIARHLQTKGQASRSRTKGIDQPDGCSSSKLAEDIIVMPPREETEWDKLSV